MQKEVVLKTYLKSLVMSEVMVRSSILIFGIAVIVLLLLSQGWDGKNSHDEFKENYRIDLKQDGYLVYDPVRNTTIFVERDSLEEWFLKDNL